MNLSSDTPIRGRILRGRAATDAVSVQRPNASLTPVGGLQLDAPVAEHLQHEGHRVGYDAGYAEGMRAAERAAVVREVTERQRLDTLQTLFGDAQSRFDQAMQQALTDIEDALATAAFLLAEAILGRELAVAENPGRDAIARALRLAPEHLPVLAYLNPDDATRLGDLSAVAGTRDIQVDIDPTLTSGDCRLRVGRTDIDATLTAAVSRARSAMGV
ncbi:MAG: FliH/SctL family protein [Acidimicrobiia bacterium]